MSRWKKIAAMQIKQKTYFLRKHRKLFLLIIYGILFYWAFYLGPNLFDIIIPNNFKPEVSKYLSNIILFVDYFISSLFLVIFIYPFYNLYKGQVKEYDFFIISSPVQAGDILLGEFFGDLIVHSAVILLIGPVLISIILQITVLNVFQYVVIYLAFLGLFALALLLGTIFAKVIEVKLGGQRTKQSKAPYLCLIFLGIMIFLSIFRFIIKFYINYPVFKNVLLFYPPSWYSNIILNTLNLINNDSYIFGIWPNIFLAINIPVIIFYIAYKKADKLYSLDFTQETNIQKKQKFRNLKKLLPFKSSENIILTQFKGFFRNKENIIRLISIFLYNFFVSGLILISITTSTLEFVKNMLSSKFLIVLLISWLNGLVFGSILGMNNFLQSKDLVFRYKSSPRGIKSLILSYLFLFLTILMFGGLIFTIFNTVLFQFNLFEIILFFLFFSLNGLMIFIQIISIQCIYPFFKEQETNIHFLIYFIGLLQVISIIISLSIWIPLFPYEIQLITPFDFYIGFSNIILTHLIISLMMTAVIFIFGIIKINDLE